MSKLQEYFKRKRIEELNLPKMYVVKSTRKGVEKPVEKQVVDIIKSYTTQLSYSFKTKIRQKSPVDRYLFDNEHPYEVDILRGETSTIDEGYGTGLGDLWEWSYFYSLSLEDSKEYYYKEIERIKNKYGNVL